MVFVDDVAFPYCSVGTALFRGFLLREEGGRPEAGTHSCALCGRGGCPLRTRELIPFARELPLRVCLAPLVPGLGKTQRGLNQAEKEMHKGQGVVGPVRAAIGCVPGREERGNRNGPSGSSGPNPRERAVNAANEEIMSPE